MANIKSQIKRNRQSERHRQQNVSVRSRLRTEAKKVRRAIESGDGDVGAQLRETSGLLDKAAARKVIHKRTAARRKSRLARAAARAGG
jgi:small subunit ribosomal protein S20